MDSKEAPVNGENSATQATSNKSDDILPAFSGKKRRIVTDEPTTPSKPKQSSSSSDSSSDSSDSSSDSSSSDSESDSDSSSSSSSSDSSSSSSESEDDLPLSKIVKKEGPAAKKVKTEVKKETKATPKKTVKKETTTPTKKVKTETNSKVKKETKATPKKEVKKETKATPKKEVKKEVKKETKKTPKKEEKEDASPTKKKKKNEPEEEEYKWWLLPPLPKGKKWVTLEHNGVLFPDPYKPHGVKMLYDGKPVTLTPEQEEIATYYAQYLETDHVKKPQFRQNFFKEWRQVLKKTKETKDLITDLNKCDFRPIHQYLMEQRELKKNRSKEEKQKEKEEKEKIMEKYGWAIVDGHKQKLANFKIEPPGLFLGRGNHPKTGTLKKRIQPEDVTINIGKDAPIPPCPVPGHKWGAVIHNDEVAWLATWKDEVNNHVKYVWLAASSRIKGESDMRKFETARKLKDKIDDIRKRYNEDMTDSDMRVRQRATAIYLIDHLALRVGNEKGEDEADTVGCCSLRVEHIKLKEPNIVEFDFLGKDSMRYQNTVEVAKPVFKNLKAFCKDKKKGDDIFDLLTTTSLNSYLKEQMPKLTAKVFRTYNASITLERELEKMPDEEMTVDEKMLFYNRANREVAILCNHQRSVSKNFSEQMGKIDDKIHELEERAKELKQHMEDLKNGKKRKREVESDDEGESAKKKQKLPDDPEKCKKQIARLKQSIAKWETKKTEKDELKTVSLTTSKINYIDPRISVAWAKKHDVPIEKIFSKTLRQKFPWAMDVGPDFKF